MVYIWLWMLIGVLVIANLCCSDCCDFARIAINYLMPALMWNVVIIFFIEGYMELIISVFVDWRYFDYTDYARHDMTSHIASQVFGMLLVLFPILIYCFFQHQTEESLKSEAV